MNNVLWSKKAAARWQEGYFLGNGRMGAVVYGGIEKEEIDLSEITFFSGEVSTENNQKDAHIAFTEMRSLVEEGNYELAYKKASSFKGKRENYGTNLPVGKLFIQFQDKKNNVVNYRRSLNIDTGILQVEYEQNGSKMVRKAFISNPDQVFCYELQSEEIMNVRIYFDGGENPFSIENKEDSYDFTVKAHEKIHSDGECGVTLNGKIQVYTDGGSLKYTEQGISISDCKKVILGIRMDTDFNQLIKNARDMNAEIQVNHNSLYERYHDIVDRHKKDISEKMRRVTLNLKSEYNDLPTDERVKSVRQGKEDIDLVQLQFQYGRYLLLASSRENSPLPAHLQGVWNDNVACRIGWTCDMHLDINTQMNYWLSEPGNLSECHMPLFGWMEEIVIPSGRITAQQSYGIKGWTADMVSNAWGYTAPFWEEHLSPCPTCGIWQTTDYIEHFRYTGDKDFLRNHAYPIIKEAVEFFIKYVFHDKYGNVSSGPSVSPENAFWKEGVEYQFSNGCTYEILMIRELFRQYSEICQELQITDNYLDQVEELLEKLIPYRIKIDGTLSEWRHDYEAVDKQHRHMSHLLGLYPFDQITVDETPELAEAVSKSIDSKLTPYDNWEDTGWSRSLLLLFSARLHKEKEAYYHIKSMQQTLTHPNLLVMHPSTRGTNTFMEVYELDGNTGYSMGVIEMLLQSHSDKIDLLPCLPSQWRNGFVKGLVARGGIEVSIEWKEGVLSEANLLSRESRSVLIKYGERQKTIELQAGENTIIEYREFR